ncbi:MAG TPA: zf-HC2 domain-containing protein [Actinomycetota bacterium]|nr:zf-HC2 domain-containing protein [Actinomycetota bacterium]
MTTHATPETLSALIDDELASDERARIQEHIHTCAQCAGRHDALASTAHKMRSLPEVVPTPSESLALRRTLLDNVPVRARAASVASTFLKRTRPQKTSPGWAIAGLIGLVAVAAAGWAVLRPSGQAFNPEPAADTTASEVFNFDNDEEIRDTLSAHPDVRSGAGKYTVADVGTAQDEASKVVAGRAGPPPQEQRTATDSSQQEEAGAPGAATQSASSCLELVLRRIPYPAMPVLARSATFKQEPAWVLAYAYSTNRRKDAPLNSVQVWIVRPADCSTLQYSSFRI